MAGERSATARLGRRMVGRTRVPHTERSARPYALAFVALCLMILSSCGSDASAPVSPSGRRQASIAPPATIAQSAPRASAQSALAGAVAGVPLATQLLVDAELQQMTLSEKLGQMIQVETYYQTDTADADTMVRTLHAGSMIIYGKNMTSPTQLRSYIATVQSSASIPLLITMDEEGGDVDRLGYQHFDPPLPSAQALGATGNPQLAYQAGVTAAKELQALGINTDLAPVVDVQEVPNPIEGPRLFGSTPQAVDTYATQFLRGLADNGIIGCLKHWPGIGSVTLDPHLTLPTLDRSQAQLDATEFAAFSGMLSQLTQQQGMIMVTHVLVPSIDPTLPSSLSPKVVGVLRNDLGYNGVIITDNLYMQAISQHYTLGQAAVLAVLAGDDLLAGAWDTPSMESMISALQSAISSGQISMARINQSVRRILTLKAMHGMYDHQLGATFSATAQIGAQQPATQTALAQTALAQAADLPQAR